MIDSSNNTIEPCEFTTEKVNVFVGYAEDNLFFEVVLSEIGGWQAIWDEECLAGKDKEESGKDPVSLDGQLEVLSSNDKGRDELLQKKESTVSLINEGINLIVEETVMSYEREFVPIVDKEDLVY